MNLESLANELLFEIFEYLPAADLFQAFYQLNSRLNCLVLLSIHQHGHWSFKSISETSFTWICQKYLFVHLDRIRSITLEGSQQLQFFLSLRLQLHQFTGLTSLSLNCIHTREITHQLIRQLHRLDHLTRLNIEQCLTDDADLRCIIDEVWSLPTLMHCYFVHEKFLYIPFFPSPRRKSHSIRSLHIEGFLLNAKEFHRLLEQTVNLHDLSIEVNHNYQYELIANPFLSMKKLKILVEHSPWITENLLSSMPSLTHLTIELKYFLLDGHQWKEIIKNYLPHLRRFHLKMRIYDRCNEQRLDQLLESFRNPFWIIEHQWYVQYHWKFNIEPSNAFLYTLPYTFDQFTDDSNIRMKSTCPTNEVHRSYNNVKYR